jgi:hypothetical protein
LFAGFGTTWIAPFFGADAPDFRFVADLAARDLAGDFAVFLRAGEFFERAFARFGLNRLVLADFFFVFVRRLAAIEKTSRRAHR